MPIRGSVSKGESDGSGAGPVRGDARRPVMAVRDGVDPGPVCSLRVLASHKPILDAVRGITRDGDPAQGRNCGEYRDLYGISGSRRGLLPSNPGRPGRRSVRIGYWIAKFGDGCVQESLKQGCRMGAEKRIGVAVRCLCCGAAPDVPRPVCRSLPWLCLRLEDRWARGTGYLSRCGPMLLWFHALGSLFNGSLAAGRRAGIRVAVN